MNIYKALNTLKSLNITCKPFDNYDASNLVERKDNGCYFKSNENEWPVDTVKYASTGNLNMMFKIPGVLHINNSLKQDCSEVRNVTVVKNGELKIQFLQLTKDKSEQQKLIDLGMKIKNNILDLSQFKLTDAIDVDLQELVNAVVSDVVAKCKNYKPRPKIELTAEQKLFAQFGLKNGIYTAPVKTQTVVEHNDKKIVKIDGLSSNTTKLAQKIRSLNIAVTRSNLNELLYNIRCLKKPVNINFTKQLTEDIKLTGTIQM